MNSLKPANAAAAIRARYENIPDGVLDVLGAALRGTNVPVDAGAVGNCVALRLCDWPKETGGGDLHSVKLADGSSVSVVVTPEGKKCQRAFALR